MVSQPRTVQRLKGSLSGTNLELTGDYNQRLVYQAIRTKGPITRNALIELTGLAKPTIAAIVRRLLSSDLVLETSRIYGGRGQPAVHLEINSEGCYAVGLHVDADRLALVVVDACGTPVRRTATDLPSTSGARVNSFVRRQFFEQTRNVRRERIIGLGIASSGFAAANDQEADSGNGVGLDLLSLSEIAPSLPIYIDSDLAAAAAGESLFGLGADFRSYYYILMDVVPVGGLVLHQGLYNGAHPGDRKLLFPNVDLRWCREAVEAERDGRREGDAAADRDEAWLAAACDDLVPLLISINCMLNPGGVLFGGRFPAPMLERLAARCNALLLELAPEIPSHAGIRPARLGADAMLIGAASLPMRARLFPTGEAWLKERDHV